jgi:nucleoid-associated protein YgaU
MFGSELDIERTFGHHGHMSRTPVRVRRRITLSVLTLTASAILVGPVAHAASGGQVRPVVARTYVVRPGDTLWSIATARADGADPRALVAAIVRANAIGEGDLQPGQQLVLPSAA